LLRISARRFEQSPFAPFYTNSETIYGVYAERFYSKSDGNDPVETYWTLRRKAVLYDVPEKPWQIEGPDAVSFLEKIFARRIGTLTEGRGRYAIACTHDGGTFMDGILFKMGENHYWYVQANGALESWLIAHSEGFDVTISDPKSWVLQIQGPNSMQIMSDATGGAIDENMKYFHSGYYDVGGQQLYVSRTGWTGELGYEIYSDSASTDHRRLWDYLMEVGSAHGMVQGCMDSMGIRRIEAGILDNLTDFDVSMTPFEAGLGAFIDLDKEGFIGKTALLQADRKTKLYGVKCASLIPAVNDEILDAAASVGRVTTGAWSPFLETGIAYVRFKQSGDWVGRFLTIRSEQGETASCEIVALPFHDAGKLIPRGLEKPIV